MPHEITIVEKKQIHTLIGEDPDHPLLESPAWDEVYTPQLYSDETFRMVNWKFVILLAQELNTVVKNQIMKPLEVIQMAMSSD